MDFNGNTITNNATNVVYSTIIHQIKVLNNFGIDTSNNHLFEY